MPAPEVGDVRHIVDDVDEEKEGKTPDPGGGNYVHVNDAPGEEKNGEEKEHRKQPYNMDLASGGQQINIHPVAFSSICGPIIFILRFLVS